MHETANKSVGLMNRHYELQDTHPLNMLDSLLVVKARLLRTLACRNTWVLFQHVLCQSHAWQFQWEHAVLRFDFWGFGGPRKGNQVPAGGRKKKHVPNI